MPGPVKTPPEVTDKMPRTLTLETLKEIMCEYPAWDGNLLAEYFDLSSSGLGNFLRRHNTSLKDLRRELRPGQRKPAAQEQNPAAPPDDGQPHPDQKEGD